MGVRSFGVKPVPFLTRKEHDQHLNATGHSIMINEHEFITPIALTPNDNETSRDLLIGSILSQISSQMNLTI